MSQSAKILFHKFCFGEYISDFFSYVLSSHTLIPNAFENIKPLVRKLKLEAKYLIAEMLMSEVFDSFPC